MAQPLLPRLNGMKWEPKRAMNTSEARTPHLSRRSVKAIFTHKGEFASIYSIEHKIAPGQMLVVEIRGGIVFKIPDPVQIRVFLDKQEARRFNLTLAKGSQRNK